MRTVVGWDGWIEIHLKPLAIVCFENWWQEPPTPASISPSPILLVFWSHTFPIPLLRVSCDDAFDGAHLVCNSFLVEKILKTCGRL